CVNGPAVSWGGLDSW
nr:immunoglobulin heavy chain junction region [Macaca mulatta]MOV40021.1 immunoglobulin heavy chain junction region [Macaca mulatta]MOV41174.1 immunoglobulin heavy chain junction region [Macaca mulatta]MOV41979.1 immunoglobulin heavy chain junction region [Macaca mulatta]MOV42846.1 immunoglobulin heavy chain junction region [Macaca mulatta]